ncbi:MAG: bifunctional 5,10-methylenetetrahydrofolate dehydrogenase/5,10-methenyltetrahydrofolate cyclohydrolase [Candidatus Omnitrophota bacterium]
MAQLIKGKDIASSINLSVKDKISEIKLAVGITPKLVSLIAGNSEDAEIYVNMQKKAADFVGIDFSIKRLDENISQESLIQEIEKLNSDNTVTSIIVQKPLPPDIDHSKIASVIKAEKDAEGLHPFNLGKLFRGEADIVPCTPGAIMKILDIKGIDLYGKEVVIIGHSAIVGKPLSLMMLNETATTTVCHVATFEKGDIREHAKKADILIVAVGRPEMVQGEWIRENAIVIDVGINKVNGKIVGDVNFLEAEAKASMITPVPGGVGPITVSILMRNVLRAYRKQNVKT